MSDTPQGPGWWMASDRRWYPPQQAAVPPPPLPGYGGGPVKRSTNGMAIASLVLGIVWVCGLGSLLALILGIVALGQIRRTGVGGRGLAIAGIVLGSLGVIATATLGTVLFLARDNVRFNQADERDDVQLIRCGLKEGDTKPSADLRIANDSSRRSSYIVIVEIVGSGLKNHNLGLRTLGPVDSGESEVFTITATEDSSSDENPFTCTLSQINRLAA